MLEQNGLRLLKLIDDLLDLVRFDTGHADVNRQPTAIAAHLDGLLRSLRHLAEQDRVALLWQCQTDQRIDPARPRQVRQDPAQSGHQRDQVHALRRLDRGEGHRR